MQWAVVPVSHWFDKGRGRAQSYLIVGGTLITSVLWFPVFERLIDAYGWRVAMRCCAVALVAVALPAAALVYHDPESVGCIADGGALDFGLIWTIAARVAQLCAAPPRAVCRALCSARVHHTPVLALGCCARVTRLAGTAEDEEDLLPIAPDTRGSPSKRKPGSGVEMPEAEATKKNPDGGFFPATMSFTLDDAMQSAPFYVICADQVSGCILGAGVFFHLIPLLDENGGGVRQLKTFLGPFFAHFTHFAASHHPTRAIFIDVLPVVNMLARC